MITREWSITVRYTFNRHSPPTGKRDVFPRTFLTLQKVCRAKLTANLTDRCRFEACLSGRGGTWTIRNHLYRGVRAVDARFRSAVINTRITIYIRAVGIRLRWRPARATDISNYHRVPAGNQAPKRAAPVSITTIRR